MAHIDEDHHWAFKKQQRKHVLASWTYYTVKVYNATIRPAVQSSCTEIVTMNATGCDLPFQIFAIALFSTTVNEGILQ